MTTPTSRPWPKAAPKVEPCAPCLGVDRVRAVVEAGRDVEVDGDAGGSEPFGVGDGLSEG